MCDRAMKVRILFAASIALLAAAGCNSDGTCVSEKETGTLGAQCIINTTKKACEGQGGKFFPDQGVGGVVRCKTLGYEDPPGAQPAKDSKELHIYYKPKAGAEPK